MALKLLHGLKIGILLVRWVINHITHGELYHADYSKKEVVSDIVVQGEWHIPNGWKEKFPAVFDVQPPLLITGSLDTTLWRTKTGKLTTFSVKTAWTDLCDEYEIAKWAKLVWYSQCVPRHAFITWVAINGKLKTQDKYMRIDSQACQSCPFCNTQKDSHNRLFFTCEFTQEIWSKLKEMARLDHAPDIWTDLIVFMQDRPINKSIWSIIQRLVLGSCVYYVWQERNMRIFQQKARTVEQLSELIKKTVRMKLLGLNIRWSRQSAAAASEIWELQLQTDMNDALKHKKVVK